MGLLSACIQSVGLTLQRKSHLLEEERIELEDSGYISRPVYRRRRWQVGMLMFLIANIFGSTIQITTLPLPVLSTLQAVRHFSGLNDMHTNYYYSQDWSSIPHVRQFS